MGIDISDIASSVTEQMTASEPKKSESDINIDRVLDLETDKNLSELTADKKDTTLEILGRDVFVNETWEDVKNYHCKIVGIEESSVDCEVVVNKELREIQSWQFPAILFKNIHPRIGDLVLISIKEKAGSIRHDVYKGTNIVDHNFFEFKRNLDDLKDAGLEDKIVF